MPDPRREVSSVSEQGVNLIAWAIVAIIAAGTLYACSVAHGRELVPGQYAQVPEEIQKWYKSVRSPSGVPCCDVADGRKTEYRVDADGTYWVPIAGEWWPVPREAVVYSAGNPEDAAIVWYVKQGDTYYIRCFVPTGGV